MGISKPTTIALAGLLVLAACAPTMWNRPGTTPAQFAQDDARCQLVARSMNPGGFSASGKPAFVAAVAVISILGTAAGQAGDYRTCMVASGYTAETPQQPGVAAAPAAPQQPVAAQTGAPVPAGAPLAIVGPGYAAAPMPAAPAGGALIGFVGVKPCLSMTCQ